jgi:hypothetical protein
MKIILIVVLFVLGSIEMLFPFGVGAMFYTYSPQTLRIFVTPEQKQLFQQIHSAVFGEAQTVFYFGVVTIAIGILLLVSDRLRKPTN